MVVTIVTLLLCVVGAVIEVFWAGWGWLIPALLLIIYTLSLLPYKRATWQHIPDLSEDANAMFSTYGHYYTMPFAARDFGSAVSCITGASVLFLVIDLFRGFWWGIVIAIIVYLSSTILAKAFNPTAWLRLDWEKDAHNEIIKHMEAQQEEAWAKAGYNDEDGNG